MTPNSTWLKSKHKKAKSSYNFFYCFNSTIYICESSKKYDIGFYCPLSLACSAGKYNLEWKNRDLYLLKRGGVWIWLKVRGSDGRRALSFISQFDWKVICELNRLTARHVQEYYRMYLYSIAYWIIHLFPANRNWISMQLLPSELIDIKKS